MKDPISKAYDLLHKARKYNKQTFGTVEENNEIHMLIYCGAYKAAIKKLKKITSGRGGGKRKREELIKELKSLCNPPIIKVHLGKEYTLPNGYSSISYELAKFQCEHPECVQFNGDMRKYRPPCKAIYRLYVYNPETKINTYKYVFIERK